MTTTTTSNTTPEPDLRRETGPRRGKKARGWLILPVAALLLIGLSALALSEWSMRSTREVTSRIDRLQTLDTLNGEFLRGLSDAESGQRGYLLAEDPRYLAAYEAAIDALPGVVTEMQVLARGNPVLAQETRALDALRGRMLTELRATVFLAKQGQRAQAVEVLRTGEANQLMQAARASHERLRARLERQRAAESALVARNIAYGRAAFLVLGVLTLALAAVAFRFLVADSERRAAQQAALEQRNAELARAVAERTLELAALTTHLQRSNEEERRQLARELHDELGGLLTAAAMDLSWLQGRIPEVDTAVRQRLRGLAASLEGAMTVKRRVTGSLRPALLEHFGLAIALDAHYREVCEKAQLRCTVHISSELPSVPERYALPLFRLGQEALTNVVRHAQAGSVRLGLTHDEAGWHLEIEDDGRGIDPQSIGRPDAHGIAGMRHRAESLGGTMTIGAASPRGTRIRVDLPELVESASTSSAVVTGVQLAAAANE